MQQLNKFKEAVTAAYAYLNEKNIGVTYDDVDRAVRVLVLKISREVLTEKEYIELYDHYEKARKRA